MFNNCPMLLVWFSLEVELEKAIGRCWCFPSSYDTMVRFNVRLKTTENCQFNLRHVAKLKIGNYPKLMKGRKTKYMIGKLRNNQNEKLDCDCERRSEKVKEGRKLVKQRVMKTQEIL